MDCDPSDFACDSKVGSGEPGWVLPATWACEHSEGNLSPAKQGFLQGPHLFVTYGAEINNGCFLQSGSSPRKQWRVRAEQAELVHLGMTQGPAHDWVGVPLTEPPLVENWSWGKGCLPPTLNLEVTPQHACQLELHEGTSGVAHVRGDPAQWDHGAFLVPSSLPPQSRVFAHAALSAGTPQTMTDTVILKGLPARSALSVPCRGSEGGSLTRQHTLPGTALCASFFPEQSAF